MLLIPACRTPDADPAVSITGRWAMDRVYDGEQDVTAEHNPAGNRWMAFSNDGTFESGGDPYGPNTGRWTLDAATGELYLDSDAGEGDDSYWIVSIEGDSMRWQGARSAFTERFTLHFARP